MRSRSDINASAVGWWGISQGGWICQLAAASYDGLAFIIPVSEPGGRPAEQEVYRVEAESRAAGFKEDEIAKAVLMRRLMIDIVLSKPVYQIANLKDVAAIVHGAAFHGIHMSKFSRDDYWKLNLSGTYYVNVSDSACVIMPESTACAGFESIVKAQVISST